MTAFDENIGTISFDEVNKYSGLPVRFEFGVLVTQDEVLVFLLQNYARDCFIERTPKILSRIRDDYGLKEYWWDLKWRFVAGAGVSEIKISKVGGLVSALSYSNAAVLRPHCCAFTLAVYQDAVNDINGLETTLLGRYSKHLQAGFVESSETVYVVHIPNRKDNPYHLLKPSYTDLVAHPVVLVDSENFFLTGNCNISRGLNLSFKNCYQKKPHTPELITTTAF